jgi:DNA mismatch repair protein MutS
MENNEKSSPMMQQWRRCKAHCPEALLLFRLGDFYEAFYQDAEELSQALSVTLTQRQAIPMAGIPAVSLDTHLEKLAAMGKKIAIAEQVEDPQKTKGLVDRQIVRVITPGTYISNIEAARTHTWILSVHLQAPMAMAVCDISTGELWWSALSDLGELEAELYRIRPKEIVIEAKTAEETSLIHVYKDQYPCMISSVPAPYFDQERAWNQLTHHFSVHNLDGFGLKAAPSAVRCLGALWRYLSENLKLNLDSFHHLRQLDHAQYLEMDRSSQKNLEITESLYEGQTSNTLLHHLDVTITTMGSRLLRQWLMRPLKDVQAIHSRQEAIEEAISHTLQSHQARSNLSHVKDIKRLSARLASHQASVRDLTALRDSLRVMPKLHEKISHFKNGDWSFLVHQIKPLDACLKLIESELCEEPAPILGQGPVFREGFHPDLDELRKIRHEAQDWMGQYQQNLRDTLGIKTLKVGYTPAFGYYIEVSKGQASLMPTDFARRQTLVASERYISQELKTFEDKVLHAQERIDAIEKHLFQSLCEKLCEYCQVIDALSEAIAYSDCLLALCEVARHGRYCKPVVDESTRLEIRAGRHPIVEKMIGPSQFVPNDTCLGSDTASGWDFGQLMLITGPNMAGKSTFIRQVALLCLMAQIGSFVPADSMHLGVLDRIFTRVGASDDLARGQSTFMVEMSETANILRHASDRSLVILDEVGRGTSTFDGIAIAQAIAEYLMSESDKKAKTLFATHYSELTHLADKFPQARNYQVAVKEWKDQVVFLHQIRPGIGGRSYGIHVAQLAGLPKSVIRRAQHLQKEMESHPTPIKALRSLAASTHQMDLLTSKEVEKEVVIAWKTPPLLEEIFQQLKGLNLNELTPLQAMMELARLQKQCHKQENEMPASFSLEHVAQR